MPSTVIPQAILPFHTQDVTAQTDTKNPLFNQAASRPPARVADLPLPKAGVSSTRSTTTVMVHIQQPTAELEIALEHHSRLSASNVKKGALVACAVLFGAGVGAGTGALSIYGWNALFNTTYGYTTATTATAAGNALLTAGVGVGTRGNPTYTWATAFLPAALVLVVGVLSLSGCSSPPVATSSGPRGTPPSAQPPMTRGTRSPA
jgi:hypothetical protein